MAQSNGAVEWRSRMAQSNGAVSGAWWSRMAQSRVHEALAPSSPLPFRSPPPYVCVYARAADGAPAGPCAPPAEAYAPRGAERLTKGGPTADGQACLGWFCVQFVRADGSRGLRVCCGLLRMTPRRMHCNPCSVARSPLGWPHERICDKGT